MGRILLTILKLFAAVTLSFAQDVAQLAARAAQDMRAGRYAEAERLYRALVQQEPKNPGWHGNLGLALHSQMKYREAAQALERSLKLKPSSGLAVVLGIDYLKSSEPCRAIAPLLRTARTDILADAYYDCKRFPEAARLYTETRDLRKAARAWWQARDYAKAKPLYQELAARHLDEADFAWEYGDTLVRVEGAQAAIPWLERASTIVEGRAALGKAYAETGRFGDAIPHLEASVQADPDLLLPLSRAYKATGRYAEAGRALSEYRKRLQSGQN